MSKPNQVPKNTTVFVGGVRAELFYQTTNADHIARSYRDDLSKAGRGRFHDMLFSNIARLHTGYVFFEKIDPATSKYRALSTYNSQLYVAFGHLVKRPDCGDQNFIVILSVYRTYTKSDQRIYESYVTTQKKIFGN